MRVREKGGGVEPQLCAGRTTERRLADGEEAEREGRDAGEKGRALISFLEAQ